MVPVPTVTQTWDDELAKRLVKAGEALGVDKYDPVVAMAEMAMDDDVDDRIRFNCHKEVAKYVRLKRQLEPTIINQQNNYILPPAQRRRRIGELQEALAGVTVIEHEDEDGDPVDV